MLVCSCCGVMIQNTAEQNASFDENPYPHDEGFGICFPCVEWSVRTFFAPYRDQFRAKLNPKNQEKWDTMTRQQQESIICKAFDENIVAFGKVKAA